MAEKQIGVEEINQVIIEERNKEFEKIEKEVRVLQDSFDDLSSMVQSQGTDIDLAGSDVDFGVAATRMAEQELEKAQKSVSRRRTFWATVAAFGVTVGAGLVAASYFLDSSNSPKK